MRKTLMLSAVLFGFGATSGYAQTSTATQSPPAPGASSQSVQPSNSLPAGAGTSSRMAPGSNLGATGAVAPMDGSGVAPAARAHPMRGHGPVHTRMRHGQQPMDTAATGGEAPADQYSGTPPTSAYQGGAGSPRSNAASNTSAANTRSEIAPRLPDPDAASNSPQAFLAAAQRALARNQTGAAQEALERAETRLLSRSTEPSMADRPDDNNMVVQIGAARRALANRDTAAARAAISSAMGRSGT